MRERATPGQGRSRAWTVDKEPVIRIRMKIDLIPPKRHARRPNMWKRSGTRMVWRCQKCVKDGSGAKGEDLVKEEVKVAAGLAGPRRGLAIWK